MSRKLDAAIADARGYEVKWLECLEGDGFWFIAPWEIEKVHLRWRRTHEKQVVKQPCFKQDGYWDVVPFWSEDGNDMLKLDAEMRARGWLMDVYWTSKHTSIDSYCIAKYERQGGGYKIITASAPTEPLAHALAAHKALTGKEWVEPE